MGLRFVENPSGATGRPNNVAISNDGKRVYVGIAQAPGAVDVIDTLTLTNAKSSPVKGMIHIVYVTPDGKYVASGSIPGRMLTVIDQATETIAWELPTSAGVRPMTFDTRPDGSRNGCPSRQTAASSTWRRRGQFDHGSGHKTPESRCKHSSWPDSQA